MATVAEAVNVDRRETVRRRGETEEPVPAGPDETLRIIDGAPVGRLPDADEGPGTGREEGAVERGEEGGEEEMGEESSMERTRHAKGDEAKTAAGLTGPPPRPTGKVDVKIGEVNDLVIVGLVGGLLGDDGTFVDGETVPGKTGFGWPRNERWWSVSGVTTCVDAGETDVLVDKEPGESSGEERDMARRSGVLNGSDDRRSSHSRRIRFRTASARVQPSPASLSPSVAVPSSSPSASDSDSSPSCGLSIPGDAMMGSLDQARSSFGRSTAAAAASSAIWLGVRGSGEKPSPLPSLGAWSPTAGLRGESRSSRQRFAAWELDEILGTK